MLQQEYALGGKVGGECGSCAGPLHRMILLDSVPAPLAQVCRASVGEESSLFFVHDSDDASPEPWTRRTLLSSIVVGHMR